MVTIVIKNYLFYHISDYNFELLRYLIINIYLIIKLLNYLIIKHTSEYSYTSEYICKKVHVKRTSIIISFYLDISDRF